MKARQRAPPWVDCTGVAGVHSGGATSTAWGAAPRQPRARRRQTESHLSGRRRQYCLGSVPWTSIEPHRLFVFSTLTGRVSHSAATAPPPRLLGDCNLASILAPAWSPSPLGELICGSFRSHNPDTPCPRGCARPRCSRPCCCLPRLLHLPARPRAQAPPRSPWLAGCMLTHPALGAHGSWCTLPPAPRRRPRRSAASAATPRSSLATRRCCA